MSMSYCIFHRRRQSDMGHWSTCPPRLTTV